MLSAQSSKHGNLLQLDRRDGQDARDLLEDNALPELIWSLEMRSSCARCYPGIHMDVLEKLYQWPNHNDNSVPLLYLCGAGGAGKSAVAQSLVEHWRQAETLGAFFFFSQTISFSFQIKRFATTIALQLCHHVPAIRPQVEHAISTDPSLFKKSLPDQLNTLVISPIAVAQDRGLISRPLHVIVDGVDDVSVSDREQTYLLQGFNALARIPPTSLIRTLITCRPDSWVLRALHKTSGHLMTRVDLENSSQTNSDISSLLHHLCNGDHQEYPRLSDQDISRIVKLTQGSFIYAITFVKFIATSRPDFASTVDDIIHLQPDLEGRLGSTASNLDVLYMHILESISEQAFTIGVAVLELLCLGVNRPRGSYARMFTGLTAQSPSFFEKLLRLSSGEVRLALANWHSLLYVPPAEDSKTAALRFHHPSLREFLLDKSRAGRFYVDEVQAHLHLRLNLMKHTIIILADSCPSSEYDELAVVRMFMKGLSHPTCPLSKELKQGLEALMSRDDQAYFRYLQSVKLGHIGIGRRIKFYVLITPKEELEVLQYLQRCNIPELEPSFWWRWFNGLLLWSQIALLGSAH